VKFYSPMHQVTMLRHQTNVRNSTCAVVKCW